MLAARGATFTKYLRPGLSPGEIEKIIQSAGVELPPEVADFYGHFNFPKEYFRIPGKDYFGPKQPTFDGLYLFMGWKMPWRRSSANVRTTS